MTKAWKICRAIILILAFTLVATPISLYIMLSTQWAQNDIRYVAVNELSALLGTEVSLGKVEIHPFNSLSIFDIKALDDFGQTSLEIEEISVDFELTHLLRTGKLVINFALVDGPSLSLYKQTDSSPLNIRNILQSLKSERPAKRQSRYDLMVSTVIIRNGRMNFDIADAPQRDSVFDPRHIVVDDVFLSAYIPRISNEEYMVEIDHFSLKEKNGFTLKDLKAAARITPNGSALEYLTLIFPNSELAFDRVALDNNGFSGFEETFRRQGIGVAIKPGSIIYPPDFSSFVPRLREFTDSIELIFDGNISADSAAVNRLTFAQPDGKFIGTMSAAISNITAGTAADVTIGEMRLSANASGITDILGMLPADKQIDRLVSQLAPDDTFSASITSKGKIDNSSVKARVSLAGNSLSLTARYATPDTFKTVRFDIGADINFRNPAALAAVNDLSYFSAGLKAEGVIAGKSRRAELRLDSITAAYRDHYCGPMHLVANISGDDIDATIVSRDRLLSFEADCSVNVGSEVKTIEASLDIYKARPFSLGLINDYSDYSLSASAGANIEFSSADDISGYLTLSDLDFIDDDPTTPDLKINSISIEALPLDEAPGISVKSDFCNAYINGNYRFSTLVGDISDIVASVFPALETGFDPQAPHVDSANNFTYNVQISECENLCKFLNLPVTIIYPVEIDGHLSSVYRTASLSVNAPYLLHGDKIIENTSLTANIDADTDLANIWTSTKMPTKKGPMIIVADLKGSSDRIDSRIDWTIERNIPINGSFNFSTMLSRDYNNKLNTSIAFHPGSVTFGSDIWTVKPSVVTLENKRFVIDDFALSTDNKSININGIVSADEDDTINVSLNDVDLLEIFETLEIDKALIGGTASGEFTGRAILTPTPVLYCEDLHVDNISYNRCVLGDADIVAFWDNDKRAFNLDADVVGETGRHSRIRGDIYPEGEGLDIRFDVNHVPVGFMKPFMEAFASDLSGYASGNARLFGTFKYIDMEGDVFAEDLKIKIDFTNTWYSASDTIRLRPGSIDIDNVIIRDINGHTATLNGTVNHIYFKEPSFNFEVTDARDFLSYNVDSRQSPDWYGTVYGNGGASISGEPGVVNIDVNMSTAPKSVFNFVLSDRLDADEYSFITFKDSRAEARRDSLMSADNVPAIVRLLRDRLGADDSLSASAYNMDLQIDITPDARMVLVMDPVGGDEIKASGSGNLRLTYGSQNNDLKMYGTYTLNHGIYNFTLQDIIIKDFTIKEGSTIAFHGDPYSAQLDIQAIYSVNANLSDLDESFLLDKDLNRTNVPVHALLKVTGDMRQPDIDFDLEFPTLTQDTYRKVLSIVSTKEMMNRQIIYLLALNRFYTPDYMASTTKGNELFSVASSTLSSQLSSMLGKLSDDWSIAPNLRSDRGDFSDVEVDVALSSRLLNNRLLFNGNFGYRDKSLNTNQFVGDFDIEYLLNPKGSWRLKAYNRYNDQNYYVRTAQTTQGIGIVFKKDFDKFFNFLRRKKKNPKPQIRRTVGSDAPSPIIIPDSIARPPAPEGSYNAQ